MLIDPRKLRWLGTALDVAWSPGSLVVRPTIVRASSVMPLRAGPSGMGVVPSRIKPVATAAPVRWPSASGTGGDAPGAGALSARRHACEQVRRRVLDHLDRVPDDAPPGLEALHAAVQSARGRLPAEPLRTSEDFDRILAALNDLFTCVSDYLNAEARQRIVDDTIAKYGSSGSKFDELTGHDRLNPRQKLIVDKVLAVKLKKDVESDQPLSGAGLKNLAQRIVHKANRLAETPLERDFPQINETLAKSATLKDKVVQLQVNRWVIQANTPGRGSYCDQRNKTIVIDPDQTLESALGVLAHEIGHALFSPPRKPTVGECASGIDYVRRCVESDFINEGQAQLVACRVAKELQAAGESAEVPADDGEFMRIYERFTRGEISEDEARKEMARKFGALFTSTTGEDYLTYYGGWHIGNWNAAHADPSMHLDGSILSTMTLCN